MAACVYWLAGEKENDLTQTLELFRKHDGWREDCETTYLTFQGSQRSEIDQSTVEESFAYSTRLRNSTEFLIDLYRRHCSKNSLCDSIFDLKEQLVALQLVMAQLNKEDTGEFTVQIQDVLEAHKKIMKHKLFMDNDDAEVSKLCSAYDKFLSHCNAVDIVDILQRIKTCFIVDESVKKVVQTSCQFVVIGKTTTDCEKEVLHLIVGSRKAVCFNSEIENQQCQLSEKSVDFLVHDGSPVECSVVSPRRKIPKQILPSPERVAKDQVVQVFLCYLRLLVNSRDELALSQAINIPNRDLAHKQFTQLRKVARDKNMPMFQIAVSFILRIRLGGKSYAPTDDNPLIPLSKGLGELVTFFQKLQNVCEETTDAKAGVLRIINMLKVNLIRAKERLFSSDTITAVAEDLQQRVETLSSGQIHGSGETAHSTMVGMKVYLLIQSMLDQHVKETHHMDYETSDISSALLTPETTQGKSKVRSLLTQFRTPDPESFEEVEVLEDDLQLKKKTVNFKKPCDSFRKVCGDMSWAKPVVNINFGPSPTTRKEQMMATNDDIVSAWHENRQCNEGTPRSRGTKRPKESCDDKENAPVEENIKKCSRKDETKPPAKRILLQKDTTCIKKTSKSRAKSTRKQIALVQGQKQLTHFFR